MSPILVDLVSIFSKFGVILNLMIIFFKVSPKTYYQFDRFCIFSKFWLKISPSWVSPDFDPTIIELDDGKIYRKPLYLMVKTMVSCRFSLKPIHWHNVWRGWFFLPYFAVLPPPPVTLVVKMCQVSCYMFVATIVGIYVWLYGDLMGIYSDLMGIYSDLMGIYSDLMGFYSDLMGYYWYIPFL